MRKLPVYLLLDTSGSMSGDSIEAVKNGVQLLVSTLRKNPYALENVFLSVITFSSKAKQLVPLTEISLFKQPELHATGCTALGEALELVAQRIDDEVVKTTYEKKGDWKPLIFILTDGYATDSLTKGIEELKKRKIANIIACAAGQDADVDELQQITEIVVQLDTTDSSAIQAYFKWLTASVSAGSKSVEDTGVDTFSADQLPPPPDVLNIIC